MNNIKNLTPFIISIFLCCFMLAGCKQIKPDVNTHSEVTGEAQGQVTDDDSKSVNDSEDSDTINGGAIFGNGGHFIKYGEKVYFRAPGADAMKKAALWGEYDNIGEGVSGTIISYDLKTDKTENLFEDTSAGPMIISKGRLILAGYDTSGESHIHSFLLDGSDKKNLPGNRIYGTQPSGNYFITGGYEEDQNLHFYICDDEGKYKEINNTLTLHDYAGISEDHLFCITCEEDETYGSLAGYDLKTGNETVYGHFDEISEYFQYPAIPEYLYTDEDYVYLQMSTYEGTGHFYSGSKWYKAEINKADSLEEVTVEGERPESEEGGPECPVVMLKDGKLVYVEGKPQTAAVDSAGYVGIYDNDGNFVRITDGYVTLYDDDHEGRTNTEICELVDDRIYIVRNNEVYDAEESVGWRDAYRRHNTWIECIDVKSGEVVNLLSINSTGRIDDGIDNGNDNDAEITDQTDNRGDPLIGLVADDILEKYRSAYPVRDSRDFGSVYDEARSLGSWVQDKIGKNHMPSDIRAMGEDIGLKYEFWYGTDVSNNFDDNFPVIYGTYFALKDYYNSDGKNNAAFYDDVCEENDLLGTGDPERIKEMYQDMQEFISACNNIIRGK